MKKITMPENNLEELCPEMYNEIRWALQDAVNFVNKKVVQLVLRPDTDDLPTLEEAHDLYCYICKNIDVDDEYENSMSANRSVEYRKCFDLALWPVIESAYFFLFDDDFYEDLKSETDCFDDKDALHIVNQYLWEYEYKYIRPAVDYYIAGHLAAINDEYTKDWKEYDDCEDDCCRQAAADIQRIIRLFEECGEYIPNACQARKNGAHCNNELITQIDDVDIPDESHIEVLCVTTESNNKYLIGKYTYPDMPFSTKEAVAKYYKQNYYEYMVPLFEQYGTDEEHLTVRNFDDYMFFMTTPAFS